MKKIIGKMRVKNQPKSLCSRKSVSHQRWFRVTRGTGQLADPASPVSPAMVACKSKGTRSPRDTGRQGRGSCLGVWIQVTKGGSFKVEI